MLLWGKMTAADVRRSWSTNAEKNRKAAEKRKKEKEKNTPGPRHFRTNMSFSPTPAKSYDFLVASNIRVSQRRLAARGCRSIRFRVSERQYVWINRCVPIYVLVIVHRDSRSGVAHSGDLTSCNSVVVVVMPDQYLDDARCTRIIADSLPQHR